ncbi:MAG: 5-formyltetrahydrofolate cyclo-ligase [Robiginitomaculum sp.]|nr:MAG: 5-formyltetrahydrofolate cyclo-ligase [Robiginitomaculum sp.]
MSFDSLEKTRARNAAKMIRAKLAYEGVEAHLDAGVELIGAWPYAKFKGGVVGCYFPLHSEISPLPLMGALVDAGFDLALPCIKRKAHPLVFRSYSFGDKLRGGAFGTKEPKRDKAIVSPDIVLLPMLAFSRVGMRLGYGGGFYDRTLQELRTKKPIFACGLAYSGQEVAILPTEQYDQALDGVLTEVGFKEFSKR